MTLLKIEIDDAVRREATALPVFQGSGGLQSGINPGSNTSMLDAADDQEVVANQRSREEATANLILAIEGATLAAPAPRTPQKPVSQRTLREALYGGDFRADDRDSKVPGKNSE